MIRGTVTENWIPVVNMVLAGQQWRAVIDTGFNGDLELPEALIREISPTWIGRNRSALAAGQFVEEDFYAVSIQFDDQQVEVEATFVRGNQILIGARLLHSHRLEIHFPAHTLLLERIEPH